MRVAAVLLLVTLALAGCAQPQRADAAVHAQSTGASATDAKPQSYVWTGHILASQVDGPSHQEPSEQVLFPLQQEGFLFDIKEIPQVFQVSLDWQGDAQLMIMLHSHKEHGTNVYDEHDSKLDATHPKCIQVPAADLTSGEWQVMVHSRGATRLDYTLTVTLLGGAGAIVKDKMHGHDPQDGQFQVTPKDVLACRTLA